MVTFNHTESGTPEAQWVAADWRSSLPDLSLADLERLVVVAAHPDDETLGAGGLLARVSRLGLPISVLVLSNGEGSHPESTTHGPGRLAELRRLEVTDAVALLAPDATVRLLEMPDGSLADCVENAAEAIGAEVGEGGPGTWVVAPWRADGHPDHTAAGDASALAARLGHARLLEYPIWAWHWSAPASPVWAQVGPRALDLTPAERSLKARALALHRSQVQPLSDAPGDEPILRASFSAHFARDFETFIDASAVPAGAEGPAGPKGETLPAPFFDDFYAGPHDRWGFETRWYERRKRALTLGAIPREHIGAALELGCSIGVLTADLADRCDTVLAVDIVEEPLRIARERLAGRSGVTFERHALPGEWPAGAFDLIVLSEVGYYCSVTDLRRLLERCRASLTPSGALLACHWRHPVPAYPLTGDAVHAQLERVAGLQRTVHHLEYDFLLEVYEHRPARSVAQREGLAP